MPDWKRIIVGDAFRLRSRDPNYYRDLLLFWPFLFSTAGAINVILFWSSRARDHVPGLELAALSLLSILFARERLLLIDLALGYCATWAWWSYYLTHHPSALAAAITTGILFVALTYFMRNHKLSYHWSHEGPFMTDILVGLPSLVLSIFLVRWIVR